MKNFDVFKHPTQGFDVVKQGFSWPAFFFSWLWAFVKKMWIHGAVFLGIVLILNFASIAFQSEESMGGLLIIFLVGIGINYFIGTKANEWRRGDLLKKGFVQIKTVNAETPEAAIAIVSQTELKVG
jgi:hypothetical protein